MNLLSSLKQYWVQTHASSSFLTVAPSPNSLGQKKPPNQFPSSIVLIVAITSLTSIVGDRFYNQPQLAVETIAPQTIIAPEDGEFEDPKTTEAKRQEIRKGAVVSLKRDAEATKTITQEIKSLLEDVTRIRAIAGDFPFLDQAILSIPSQISLRQLDDDQWQTYGAIIRKLDQDPPPPLDSLITERHELTTPIQELYRYAQTISPQQLQAVITQIMIARAGYQQAVKEASTIENNNLFQQHQNLLLRLSNDQWETAQAEILKASDRILVQGIPKGLSNSQLQEAIQVQLGANALSRPFAVDVLAQNLRPNLIEDKDETKRRSEQAALAVEPVMVSISAGEVIVTRGDTITQEDFVLLDGFGLSDRQINWFGLGSYALMVTGAVGIMTLVILKVHRPMRCRDHLLLLLISMSSPLLVLFDIPYNNLSAVGLLTSSLYSPTLAVTQVSLLSGVMAVSNENVKWDQLIAGTVGGLIAAVMGGRLRSREEQATMGVTVGIAQTIVSLVGSLSVSASAGTLWYVLLPEAAIYGFSGTAWIVLALGISPYLERLFDLVTPIRLAELSNPNRPLLKRLALEAPGTFQHTMFVASLAEAAARELHCNVELVRAGTLYHDIGKMHDPLGFIENQMGGPNKHDQLKDPLKSTEIIRKHVTEGLVMAKKYGLPKALRDFIPEHQGRLLISYFYYQARTEAEREGRSPDSVNEEDFRYAGPIPQSRETGLVMLADGCEAALRSLKEATPEQAIIMMNKIFRARWQDGQLADCGIRREELPFIAEVFVRVWQQHNHQRIAYPQAALEPRR